MEQRTAQHPHYLVGFVPLYIATIFVNKYVLSVLRFTYPTIFQGWQTLAGVIMLRIMVFTGKVEVQLSITSLDRDTLARWLPAMMLYLISIYSGSVALANLPIPIFLCLHNVTMLVPVLLDLILHKKILDPCRYLLQMVILLSAILVPYTDPQYQETGYTWITIHIISTGLYQVYDQVAGHTVIFGEMEKIFCNYFYSMIILAPCTYLLGDILAAQKFEFFNLYKFYIGCLCSGVFGALLSVSTVFLSASTTAGVRVEQVIALSKVLAVLLSLLFFEELFTAWHAFWILANMAAALWSTAEDVNNICHSIVESVESVAPAQKPAQETDLHRDTDVNISVDRKNIPQETFHG